MTENELPELKGFSERNLGRMLAFYREYQFVDNNLPRPVTNTVVKPNICANSRISGAKIFMMKSGKKAGRVLDLNQGPGLKRNGVLLISVCS